MLFPCKESKWTICVPKTAKKKGLDVPPDFVFVLILQIKC